MVVQGGMRYMRLGAVYQDAQRQVLIGMNKVLEELSRSTTARRDPLAPIALPGANHIIFLSPQPPPPQEQWSYAGTELQYHAWVCFYRDAVKNELVRVAIPLSSPSTSHELGSPPGLTTFQGLPAGSGRTVVARNISDFLVNDGPTSLHLSIELAASVSTGTDKNTTVWSRSVVHLPNT